MTARAISYVYLVFGITFCVTIGILEQGHTHSVISVESINRRRCIMLYFCFIAQ